MLAARGVDEVSLPGATVYGIYLRQRTAAGFIEALRRAFGGSFTSIDGFLDHLNADPRLRKQRKILVLDGLDEAADEAARLRIARETRRVGVSAPVLNISVVVSCRSGVGGSENERLIETLGPKCTRLDVDNPRYVNREDFRRFVERRLLNEEDGRSPYQGQDEKVELVARQVTAAAYPIYLVAQLITRALLDDPELSEEELRARRFPSTVSDAFDDYLARFESDEDRARDLMSGLSHARGAGFARGDVWLNITQVVTGVRYELEDIDWLLHSAAAFLIESAEVDGSARYRLYHQALVDMLLGERTSEVFDQCVLLARTVTDDADTRYFRSHLPGHALAAGRLAELLTSPHMLSDCSIEAVLRDSERSGVDLPEPARRARSALRSVQSYLDNGDANEHSAYLALAGQQFGVPEFTGLNQTGPWWPHFADWRASSDHRVLVKERPVTKIEHARISGEDVVVVGDADGTVTFELMDGSGRALQEMMFSGSISHLSARWNDRVLHVGIATDAGDVHLVRVSPVGVKSVRVMHFTAPLAGIALILRGIETHLLAACIDGTVQLDVRKAMRRKTSLHKSLGQPVNGISVLRGGRSLSTLLTSDNSLMLCRTEDLALAESSPVLIDEIIYQLFDSWYSPDRESSVIYSSASGLHEVGLEFGETRTRLGHVSNSRFVCSVPQNLSQGLVCSDATSLVVYEKEGPEIQRLRGHEDHVVDIIQAETTDGHRIISAAEDGSVRVWGTDSADNLREKRPEVVRMAVWPTPFATFYQLKDETVWFRSAHSNRRVAMTATNLKFDDFGMPFVEAHNAWTPADVGDDWFPHTDCILGESAHAVHVDEEREVDWQGEWSFVSFLSGTEDQMLCVSDGALRIAGVRDDYRLVYRDEARPGLSERAGSSLTAVTCCFTDGVLHIFVADGSWLRVYDDRLKELARVAVSGGPVRRLVVRTARLNRTVRASFGLVCESGLLAGELSLNHR
ncbi:WD40 repeat domain-containing protein [Nocardioides sp. Soil796]|uniref:WD40 repeat domain-containing protein n=1 Tax=Nocardioides sp. Soil796 TaxID=1736412 RepID=UPI001F230031